MMILNNIKIAVVSDIHLGGSSLSDSLNGNKASKIISNLKKYILTNENKDLDILFIAGDFFDTLLNLNHPDVEEIDYFIYQLCKYCLDNSIKLRVLEGTPSHDRKQSERFLTIAKICNFDNLDLKYFNNVAVEYFEEYDFNVLYVPDEIQPSADKTLKLVQTTLEEKGLSKVDIAIMHGQFEYQLPQHIKNIPRHSSQDYLNIVKYFIFIGHIHTFSVFDRIIAQGSFDRLSHGQEEPKGYVVANISKDTSSFYFIENKEAKLYKTLDCSLLDLEQTLSYIRDVAKSLPEDSAIRIAVKSDHPILANILGLVIEFPYIKWTKKILDKESEEKDDIYFNKLSEQDDFVPVTITKDNVQELLKPRLLLRFNEDQEMISKSYSILQGCL